MKKRSNTTLVILVIALLGLVGMVGAIVNGKPPGPPEPEKKPTAEEMEKQKGFMGEMEKNMAKAMKSPDKGGPKKDPDAGNAKAMSDAQKAMRDKYAKTAAARAAEEAKKPKFNTNIEVTSDYWGKYSDGTAGTSDIRKKADDAEAQQRAMIEKSAKKNEKMEKVPVPTPSE